ncbi:MAG: carotenoid 1,2-hydratase [Polyangiales bacterium]
MLGSVFSPFYAKARARGGAVDPLDHCALNVALYTPRGKLWSLDERGRDRVHRDASSLSLGASVVAWERDALVFHLRERTTPFLTARPLGDSRIVGKVTVRPRVRVDEPHALDADGAHLWWSAAPSARVEVELDEPGLRWTGDGYHDANAGDGPLEDAFRSWDWSRASVGDDAVIVYDPLTKDGRRRPHARRVTPSGRVEAVELPRTCSLPRTPWGVERATRTDGPRARVRETLEDSPFYARSVLDTRILGRDVAAVHETLDLERFRKGWVQFLLPFKTRRL